MQTIPLYKNGHWAWDEVNQGIFFISHDVRKKQPQVATLIMTKTPPKQAVISSIRFKENVDNMEKIYFRGHYQRRVKPNEPDLITLQDVKDVVLFLANPKDVSLEFVNYFHVPEIDKFLKAIIIYFKFYCQVWEKILERREEIRRKLRQPIVSVLEDIVRDDLGDLRSLVAREYCTVLLGYGGVKKYHHLSSSTNSLSEKDRRLFECLICMSGRVAWIALQRKHLNLIELEINRMLRTDLFNVFVHRNKNLKGLWRTLEEDRILVGTANIRETKLKQRSALLKELLLAPHDYRMLGISFKHFEPESDRIQYLEKLFALPEEQLHENGLSIGLVGLPREEYDCMMMVKERTSQNFNLAVIEPVDYILPPRVDIPDKEMPKTFPKEPCPYQDSEQTSQVSRDQCKTWRKHIHRTMKMRPSTTPSSATLEE